MTQPTRPQHAPSPDYTDHSTVTPELSLCPDCGDLHLCYYAKVVDAMRARGSDRCPECVAQHADELAIAKRLLRSAGRALMVDALTPPGGMNDPRDLLCEECGDVALTYTGSADSLDRAKHHCESCGTLGVIDVDQDDEGHVRARFLGAP